MTDERIAEQNSDEVVEKKSFLSWVKEHKTQLLLAGISVTTILAAAIGLKNKDAIEGLCASSLVVDKTEDQLTLASWIGGADKLGDALVLYEIAENFELLCLILWNFK